MANGNGTVPGIDSRSKSERSGSFGTAESDTRVIISLEDIKRKLSANTVTLEKIHNHSVKKSFKGPVLFASISLMAGVYLGAQFPAHEDSVVGWVDRVLLSLGLQRNAEEREPLTRTEFVSDGITERAGNEVTSMPGDSNALIDKEITKIENVLFGLKLDDGLEQAGDEQPAEVKLQAIYKKAVSAYEHITEETYATGGVK